MNEYLPCNQCIVLSMCIQRFRYYDTVNEYTNDDAINTIIALSLECSLLDEYLDVVPRVQTVQEVYRFFDKLSD